MASHASPRDLALLDDASSLLDSLRRIVRHLRLVQSESESSVGVAPAQLFVLSRLAHNPASSIRELAERTMTDPSSVSVVLGKLEARGLISRTPHPTDKRRTQLSLTKAGRATLSRAPELPQVHMLAALENLPSARRRAMVEGLKDVVVALGATRVAPELMFEDEPTSAKKPRRPRARKVKARNVDKA